MGEVVQIEDQFYILASASLSEGRTRVLKYSDTFIVTNLHGDIRPLGFEDHGLYHEGTRFLSKYVLNIEGQRPVLLNSSITKWNDFLVVNCTNPDFYLQGDELMRRGTLHLNRSLFLWGGCAYETVKITNYGQFTLDFSLTLDFGADFVDIFEVRGIGRMRRGSKLDPVVGTEDVLIQYLGLDNVQRSTRLVFRPQPDKLTGTQATYKVRLEPSQTVELQVEITCTVRGREQPYHTLKQAFSYMKQMTRAAQEWMSQVDTNNQEFNNWVSSSRLDTLLMLSSTPYGWYPYAGIPWYSTVFGRDGIITAMQTLWVAPAIARGVLSFLAARQATETIPDCDAQPGKILHELRYGEMANLREVPFGSYYGTVDATPLFVILACQYLQRTGDVAFIRNLWPAVERALDWIDIYGDMDGDGFVEYKQQSKSGLYNQGWKDSMDAVFHSDGALATPPIALCEVQAYVYEAKTRASWAAEVLGFLMQAGELAQQAKRLQSAFDKKFWYDDLGTYALALDQDKEPCKVRTSNAGHALFSGIASQKHASDVVAALMDETSFNGWGIRTVQSQQSRYNPMSYHNGSVWPHDNSLIGFGMARYGFKREAAKLLSGFFEASTHLEFYRLPELFCGFPRVEGEGPTSYPVACSPQAWASASVFLLLQGLLGLTIDSLGRKVYFDCPYLPPFLREMTIRNLSVGSAVLDIAIRRQEEDTAIVLLRRKGDVEVIVRKPPIFDYPGSP